MKKSSNAYVLLIVLIFVQTISACGYFAPEKSEGEPETSTAEPIVIEDEIDSSLNSETATKAPPTIEATVIVDSTKPLLPPPTSEPTPTPTQLSEAAILTNTSNLEDPAPRLIGRSPAKAASLELDQSIELYFDQPMEPGTTTEAFTFTGSNGEVIPGTVEWPQPRILRFTPETVLTTGSQYNVILAETATAVGGKSLTEMVSLDLFTIGELEVDFVFPADGTFEVAEDSTITVIFNRPIVPLVNAEDQDNLPSPIIISPATDGAGEWVNTSIYIWRPENGLIGRANYKVSVSSEVVNNVSSSGAKLAEDVDWQFSVVAPTLKDIWLPTANFKPIGEPMVVTFNQPMDEPATQESIRLRDAVGNVVPLEFSWGELSTSVTMTATRQLELNARYKLTVEDSALSAKQGRLREGESLEFSTVDFPSISIQQTARSVDPNRFSPRFAVVFNTAMDADSLAGKIIFDPPLENGSAGSYNTYGKSFSFWGLSPATDYTVTILPGMKDIYGNGLFETQTLAFRTTNFTPAAAFQMRYPLSLYRFNGSSSTWVRHINAQNLQLNVYGFNDFRDFFRIIERQMIDDYNPSNDILLQSETMAGAPGSNQTQYTEFDLRDQNGNMHPPGFYIVTLNAGGVDKNNNQNNDIRLALIANANLTIKTNATDALAWLTSLDTGEPIGGEEVILYDEQFTVMGQAVTDEDGIARLTDLTLSNNDSETYYVVVDSDTATAASITGQADGFSLRKFDLPTGSSRLRDSLAGYIYTDRPLYRPNQTVFIKGIVREENDLSYAVPDLNEVTLKVEAISRDREEIFQEVVPLNDDGTFELSLKLENNIKISNYRISVFREAGTSERARWIGEGEFKVAEFRKPTFQVNVDGSAENIVNGDTFTASVDAEFFSGGGVSNSLLEWSLEGAETTFEPSDPNLSRYNFSLNQRSRRYPYGSSGEPPQGYPITKGRGSTDQDGAFTLELPGELENVERTRLMTFEAIVVDLAGNVIAGRTSYTIHPAAQYVGIKSSQNVGAVGQDLSLDLVAIDLDSQPIPDALVDVQIVKTKWILAEVENDSGEIVTEWQYEEELVSEIPNIQMDENGRGSASFNPEEGGSYRAYARSQDTNGKTATSGVYFWVYSSGYIPSRPGTDQEIKIVLDADEYAIGDTAKLLIDSPFDGTAYALVTVERGSIQYSEMIKLTDKSTLYEFAVTEEMIPNGYLSVMVMKGVDEFSFYPKFKVDYTQFAVDRTSKELKIAVVPNQEKLGPSETVSYEIAITDADGKPVEAELSLALVDLSILSLRKESIPTMLDTFYGYTPLRIKTALLLSKEMDSLNAIVAERAKSAEGEVAQQGGGGGGGGGGGDSAADSGLIPASGIAGVRDQFKDTAHWTAIVKTDSNGKATADIILPDNLTTWRLDVRAVSADTKVGQVTNDVVTTRPLLVSPQTPRFFVVGDEVTLGTMVRNTTSSPIEATVSMLAQGLDILNADTQTVRLEANGQLFITWQAVVQDVDRVDLVFQAKGGGFVDASRPPVGRLDNQGIPVYKYEIPETVGTSGQLLDGGVIVESIGLPTYAESNYLPSEGHVTIEIAPSLAAAMTSGLDYLTHYEYESTEQLVSKFLPNVLMTQAMAEAGISDPELLANLDEQGDSALEKIIQRQRPDGGWAWWDQPNSRTNTLVTGYVVLALIKAEEAGYDVPQTVTNQGVVYLQENAQRVDGLQGRPKLNRQAFIAYVLAQTGQDITEPLFLKRNSLDLYAQAYLARAMHVLDPTYPQLEVLKAKFVSTAIVSASGTHWEEAGGNDFWNWNSDIRTSAIVLGTMVQIDPENPLVTNSVRWLMNNRVDGRWQGTQTTAWTLMALTNWMVISGELEADFNFEVALNGELIGQGIANQDTLRTHTEIVQDISKLKPNELNKLAIGRTAGGGNLYYTARVKVGLPVDQVKVRNDGIMISRSYFDPANPTEPITEAKVGDTVLVRISIVAPNDLYYVGIADWLPAGLEPIDASLETTAQNDPANAEQGGQRTDIQPSYYRYSSRGFGWWYFQHIQLRDEKVELSANRLPKGTYEYVYLAKAVTPGTFSVIPPQAEQFYHPEVSGRGAGSTFVIYPVGGDQ